ncbi:MAG: hypothetical protein QXH92_01565 [Candidatus Aenigmatarchaeota archaeon]
MSKFSPFIGKVNVPCRKCHEFVKVGIFEKLETCPYCRAKWGN